MNMLDDYITNKLWINAGEIPAGSTLRILPHSEVFGLRFVRLELVRSSDLTAGLTSDPLRAATYFGGDRNSQYLILNRPVDDNEVVELIIVKNAGEDLVETLGEAEFKSALREWLSDPRSATP